MTFEVTDPGWPVFFWWSLGALLVLALLLFLIDAMYIRHGGLAAISVIMGVSAFFLLGTFASGDYSNEYSDRVVQGIESHGFEQVDLTDRTFSASLDGEYFKGQVIQIETDVFQIVEIAPVEGSGK